MDQPQPLQHVQDAVDRRGRNGGDKDTARFQILDARVSERAQRVIGDVLEDRECGDDVEPFGRHVVGETAADHAPAPVGVRARRRVDADPHA